MLLAFVLFPILAFGQDQKIIIKGKIKDEMGDIIPFPLRVNQIKKPENFVRSDKQGNFTFRYSYTGDQKDGIMIHSAWFQDLSIAITKKQMRRVVKDTLYIEAVLQYITLEGPTITLTTAPDTAFSHPLLSVQDFEFYNGRYVLLTFEKNLARGTEILLATNDSIISRMPVPGDAVRLFKDYQERIYVICKEKVLLCSFRNDNVAMSETDYDEFYKTTWMILDTLKGKYYYSNRNDLYPAYEYFAQNFGEEEPTKLHYVEDELIMDLYRAEYKYADGQEKLWAARKEMETGVDKEIWMGAKYFTHSLYYKVPYAPLFVKEDTVLVFDHYKDMMFKFDVENHKVDSLPIYYHKATKPSKWHQPLIGDESTEDIYGLFMRQGHYHLKRIDQETGRPSLAFRIYYKFVDSIKIDDGYVYYIYRPYESAQERYIYRERIKLVEDAERGE